MNREEAEAKLIDDFQTGRYTTDTLPGFDDAQVLPFHYGAMVVEERETVEFGWNIPLVSFHIKHGSRDRVVSFPRDRKCTFRDLSDLIQAYVNIHPENQRLICEKRLVKPSHPEHSRVLLETVDRKEMLLLGTTERILSRERAEHQEHVNKQSVYVKRTESYHRARKFYLDQIHANYISRCTLHRMGAQRVEASKRLFGINIAYPTPSISDLAASILGVGCIPRFRCYHRDEDDPVNGLGCQTCTPAWIIDMYAIAATWNDLRMKQLGHLVDYSEGCPDPADNPHDGCDHVQVFYRLTAREGFPGQIDALRALHYAWEQHSALHIEWFADRPSFDAALRELAGFNIALDMDACWDDETLIGSARRNDIQEDAGAMQHAAKVFRVLASLRREHPDFDIFEQTDSWGKFVVALSREF